MITFAGAVDKLKCVGHSSAFVWFRGASFILSTLSILILTSTLSAQTPLTQPHTLRENFQGDSLGQFASYPPAQDVGYEPSLAPTSQFNAPGGRALMRVIKPNRAGPLRFGFIRKVQMVVNAGATLSLTYRINTPDQENQIEVGLAGTNGVLYTSTLAVQSNRWSVVTAKFSELRDSRTNPPPSGLRIEAIYLVANLRKSDPDTTYRFMIDDLSLQAAREAGFSISKPGAESIEPWPMLVSSRAYRLSDQIAFEATAPALLKRVDLTLKNPEGHIAVSQKLYDDGTHGDRSSADGVWSNEAIYSLRTADQPGLWSAELQGETATGEAVRTVLRLLVHPAPPAVAGLHPRLFFTAADRQKLVERSRDSKLASLWAHVQTTAKTTRESGALAHGGAVFELLDSEYLLPSLLAYFDVLNRARSRIAYNAFEAYVSDSAGARAAAKAAMLEVANWKRWQPPWFNAHGQHTYYPAGLLAADVALGYDLLYDSLSEAERARIRQALIEKSIIPTYKEYVLDNRVMTNTSNWIAHTVGGALIAACAIADDVQASQSTPESKEKFETYLNGLLLKLEDHLAASYLADGSYGEGISYHEFDMETLGPALNAVRRAFGINYWKQSHVLESITYPLYTLTQPTSASLDMGDTHAPAGHGIPAQVFESRDPVVRWYYAQFDRPSLSKFIFYDDSVAPKPPKDLPTSRMFYEKGNAVFRSSWDKDAIVFLYRAGPNFNHHHADQGSFLLNAFGESLISEAGWSDYYKDPYYATFFTQAAGHSTILVDGNPESQSIADTPQFAALNSFPRTTDVVTSEYYDGIGSELSSVYQNRLARYLRRIVFVKPYYFVVFDDLKVNGNPTLFDFLLHLPNRDKIKIDGSTAVYNGEKASLAVRSFTSQPTKLTVENGRIPYHIFAARTPADTTPQPAYLDFKTVTPASAAQFLTAIVPAKNEGALQNIITRMTEVGVEGGKGISVDRGDEKDLVMFRGSANTQMLRQGEWQADAATLVITLGANNLKMFAVQNARALRRGNRILFSSDSPASVAAKFSTTESELTCNAETATRILFYLGKPPIRVLLDGKELSATASRFKSTDGTVSLDLPRGQHNLRIVFR